MFSKILILIKNKLKTNFTLQYLVFTILIMALAANIANAARYNINRVFLFAPSIPMIIDILIFSLFFYPIFIISKNKKLFYSTEFLFAFYIYFSNSLKYSVLSTPIRIFELRLIKEIFLSLPLIYGLTVIFMLSTISILILININYKETKKLLYLLVFPIFISLSLYISKPLENITRLMVKDGGETNVFEKVFYKKLGSFYYIYFDLLRNKNMKEIKNRSQEEINKSITELYKDFNPLGKTTNLKEKNVFLIVVESLSDLSMYVDKNEYEGDLFSEDFRKMFNKTDNSLSIATKMATCNGMFETLCGFPLIRATAIFNDNLNKDIPCLPNILNNFGYNTKFYSINNPAAYNFGKINKKIGFKKSYFENEIKTNKKYGIESTKDYILFNFIYNDFKKDLNEKNTKNFYYALTIGTHHPYTEYKNKGLKNKIKINAKNRAIHYTNYINSMYYSTEIIADFVKKVHESDPNALIIITADHPSPSLTKNGKGEIKNKRNDNIFGLSVPLIIIDGKDNYKTNLKQVHYKIPKTILESLNINSSILDYDIDIYNLRFLMRTKNPLLIDTSIKVDEEKINDIEILFYDIFYGKQLYKNYNNKIDTIN